MEAVIEILNKMPDLSYSELEEVQSTVKKIMIEKRREEMRRNAEESKKLYAEGKLKSFTDPNELIKWLMEEDEEN
jgi:hypothetical protein